MIILAFFGIFLDFVVNIGVALKIYRKSGQIKYKYSNKKKTKINLFQFLDEVFDQGANADYFASNTSE